MDSSVKKPLIITVALLLFIPQGKIYSQTTENLTPEHWAYEALDYLNAKMYFSELHYSTKPFNRINVAKAIQQIFKKMAHNQYAATSYELYLLHRLEHEFRYEIQLIEKPDRRGVLLESATRAIGASEKNFNEHLRGIQHLSAAVHLGKKAAIFNRFEVDTDGFNDPDHHGRVEWKSLAGDMPNAYALFSLPWFRVLVGRDALNWGPSSFGSLILSTHAPTLDMVAVKGRFWKCEFSAFNAFLSRSNALEDSLNVNKYLSGHRISFKLNDRFTFGISETVLYGGPNHSLNYMYANPLIPYYLTDVIMVENEENNVLVGADFSWIFKNGMRGYGELLIDEYYYEEDYANKTAFTAGLELAAPFSIDGAFLTCEYTRIQNWTYNYIEKSRWNKYTYFRGMLGHPLGPDADRILISGRYYLGHHFHAKGLFSYTRNGEGDIQTPMIFTNGWSDAFLKDSFPSGIVEENSNVRLRLEYSPNVNLFVAAQAEYNHVANAGHVPSISEEEWFFNVDVTWRIRYFIDVQ